MHSQFLSRRSMIRVALLTVALSSSACTQMMRHSNTLVFGTDTTIGVKVGQDVNQAPSIDIGYGRKEAAFVPLLANTGPGSGGGDLTPCAPASTNDCHFRASHDGKDRDSYSTIASFGSKIGTTTGADEQGAEVAIAQYFATGIAAQRLVLTGGANIVQAGGNTKAKADAAVEAAKAISVAEQARARASAEYDQGRTGALAILGGNGAASLDTTTTGFRLLHERMGGPCSPDNIADEMEDADKQLLAAGTLTVDRYLEVIRNEIPSCFDNLIVD